MALQLCRRNIQRLVRESVVIVGCVAGLVAVTLHVLSVPTSVSRILIEASSASDSYSCEKLASWETSGGIVLYIMVLVYIFVSLAIICDDYFVSALKNISQMAMLPPDVAGATFMAAGSSAPELFASLADNVFKKPTESMGVGIIVGSALFNILIIISLSALLAGQVLKLDWRPLLRDSLWYTWAMSVLTYAVWDGSVDVPDSVVMVCSYASYIGYMAFSERVVSSCCKRQEVDQKQEKDREKLTFASVSTSDGTSTVEVIVTKRDVRKSIVTNEDVQKSMDKDRHLHSQHECLGEQDRTMLGLQQHMFQAQQPLHHMVFIDRPADVEAPTFPEKDIAQNQLSDAPVAEIGEESLPTYFNVVLVVPAGILAKLWFVFTWPIMALARITIPDCRYPAFSGPLGIFATFVASMIWIGVLSHYTVTFGTKLGCIAGIPSALMGLTIMSAGTSIPDALSSVLAARTGHGDMVVSNALGSNVFDILVGLGLPFLLSNLVYGQSVPVSADDLNVEIAILFAVLLFVVLVLVFCRWRLYPLTCIFLLLLYAAYVSFLYLRGLDII